MPEDKAVKHHRAMTDYFGKAKLAISNIRVRSRVFLSQSQTSCSGPFATESVTVSVMSRKEEPVMRDSRAVF